MPKSQLLFSAVFGFRNPSKEIFSELDEINAWSYFCSFQKREEEGSGATRRRHTRAARPSLGRAALVCGALVWPPLPFRLLKASVANPKAKSHDTENLPETPPPRIPSRGIQEIISRSDERGPVGWSWLDKRLHEVLDEGFRENKLMFGHELREFAIYDIHSPWNVLHVDSLETPLDVGITLRGAPPTIDAVCGNSVGTRHVIGYSSHVGCVRPELSDAIMTEKFRLKEDALIKFLRERWEIFASEQSDMPGIPRELAEHALNVDPTAKPVQQTLHRFSEPKRKVIGEEVNRLSKARFIRELKEAKWVANPVMVPKKDTTSLRMCIDFTSLNKHCIKDHFPLSRIDQIVDSTAGCDRLSFLDAYSGYNQIKLKEEEQELTTFIRPHGVYCYNVMSFGLKNAGATYQRCMQACLGEQIGQNIEVYIDDIIVKTHTDR
ncbi:hypothetical protein QYE76_028054 [Lolium multiflorum]|uniref:Reverse transcriptase domain-containing protein n=1 Tax=Lolium multiflorum TaxID=4521 RepID=A0AAD8QK90_LOLMU|nr:hypothetical protein QYE76_028054 [Lolium multiflorum]